MSAKFSGIGIAASAESDAEALLFLLEK